MILEITCSGTPYEIGRTHGSSAKTQIHRGIEFYKSLFLKNCKLQWSAVCDVALQFEAHLQANWPHFVEEMKGVAEGAGVPFASILALNVRTEIAYGMFNDGCTALSWATDKNSFLAQNWDWEAEQAPNLISLRIHQPPKPSIHMITEAGIIGKIGLNSTGLKNQHIGVTLNAIKAAGLDATRLPVHLALRACLDSNSKTEALNVLEQTGVAAAAHILVADGEGGMGVETSAKDIVRLEPVTMVTDEVADPKQTAQVNPPLVVLHTNHYIAAHQGVKDMLYLKDSPDRLQRIAELVQKEAGSEPSREGIGGMLEDEKGAPTAIYRKETETSTVASLFTIVMDLKQGKGWVKIRRPHDAEQDLVLDPKGS